MAACVCGYKFFQTVDRHAPDCPINLLTTERDRYKVVFEAAKKFEEVCRSEEGDGHTWSGASEKAADALFALLKS